jgi:hypothetical protein
MDLRETGWGWIRFNWLRIGTGRSCCECGDEPSGSCVTELVSLPCCMLCILQEVSSSVS